LGHFDSKTGKNSISEQSSSSSKRSSDSTNSARRSICIGLEDTSEEETVPELTSIPEGIQVEYVDELI